MMNSVDTKMKINLILGPSCPGRRCAETDHTLRNDIPEESQKKHDTPRTCPTAGAEWCADKEGCRGQELRDMPARDDGSALAGNYRFFCKPDFFPEKF